MTDMEAAEARLNAEERAAAEAGSSLELRMRPIIAPMDVFTTDSDDEDMPDKDDGRCSLRPDSPSNVNVLLPCIPASVDVTTTHYACPKEFCRGSLMFYTVC